MDEKLKKKWVKALRSGKYNQGKHKLRSVYNNEVQHCCLGVLCEITPGIEWDDSVSKYVTTNKKVYELVAKDMKDDGDIRELVPGKQVTVGSTLLPNSLRKEFGMNKRVQFEGTRMDLQNKFANMNDSGRMSFEDIADYIEGANF